MKTAIECIAVGRNFGALAALEDVSFKVMEGEIRALIGPNGAGKTTLFNVINGTIKPSAGKIHHHGVDVTGLRSESICQRGISRTFQLTSLFAQMTGRENVSLAAQAKLPGRWYPFGGGRILADAGRRADEALERLSLGHIADTPAAELSHGDQRLLEVAMAMAQSPDILMLDEPTQGLSISETQEIIERLRGLLKEQSLTVVLVEHDMEVVFELADRIAVLHRGHLIADGTVEEVRGDALVQEAYLGGVD
jgi:branched-chain amino acid transport system ATP-binding protein